MDCIIGSFNIRNFSGEGEKRDLNRITKIIKGESFDVVALQEIFSELAVKQLVDRLGNTRWSYCWGESDSSQRSAKEGYGYIWKNTKFRMVEEDTSNFFRNSSNSIFNFMSFQDMNPRVFDRRFSEVELIRPPFIIRLAPVNSSFCELRLINTHIVFSAKTKWNEKHGGDISKRQRELEVLFSQVYKRVADKRYGNYKPAYTVMLGDYNLDLKQIDATSSDTKMLRRGRYIMSVQDEKTSLMQVSKDVDSEENIEYFDEKSQEIYSKNYDHFSFDDDYMNKMNLRSSRVEAVTKYKEPQHNSVNDMLKTYHEKVSDHVPVKLKLSLRKGN